MSRMLAMDHIVLNVEDMDTILDFYTNVLGLEPERLEEFRQGKVGFPSVRINADTVIDLFPLKEPVPVTATPLRTDLNHFCMVLNKEDMPVPWAPQRVAGPSSIMTPWALRWSMNPGMSSLRNTRQK